MHILLAQINPTIGDLPGNSKKIVDGIAIARQMEAQIVVFPELSLCGYPPEDLLLLPHFIEQIQRELESIIPKTKGLAALIGLPRYNPEHGEKSLRNSAAIVQDGMLIGYQDKMLLPTYDVFDERRFFTPANHIHTWNIFGHTIAITICEDIWQHSKLLKYASYPEDPIVHLAKQSPECILNLSASPYSVNHFHRRIDVCSKAAKTVGCPLLLCNQVGGNDSLIFDGRSLYVNKSGQFVAAAKAFQEDYLLVDLNQKATINSISSQPASPPVEDIYNALVLGLRDYFQKLGFKKACLGLSGGVDSALVACIAAEALGPSNILGLLMPSRYSSEGSIIDARQLVEKLGIHSHEISIEQPFENYLNLFEPYFSNYLPNVTEENIQARIRGMILMAFSNKLGYIVLSTGNKSELALGYSTLYGDMCGGLAVISDVTKTQVYSLAQWINRNDEIIPWNTINKPPSAELRPNQKDSDSLPDYSIVDNVLEAYIEQHLSPQSIAARFNYPQQIVNELIKRIHDNEYKRRQSPPGLRISEKAFSVGRRFPIVQKYVVA